MFKIVKFKRQKGNSGDKRQLYRHDQIKLENYWHGTGRAKFGRKGRGEDLI